MSTQPDSTPASKVASFFESFIYGGRWLLAPMYVGLLAALVVYTLHFLVELQHLIMGGLHMIEAALMLSILSLIDACMLGNLILLIMIGSYSVFIRRLSFPAQSRPQWLDHISSGLLKVKMSTSVIGVSMVQLVKTFYDLNSTPTDILVKQGALHILFLVSGLGIAYIDKISHSHPSYSTPTNPTH